MLELPLTPLGHSGTYISGIIGKKSRTLGKHLWVQGLRVNSNKGA